MRPSTAATTCSTATTATQWREVVLAVIANKGNEVGACSCNMQTMEFKLYQYTDQPTVPQTLMLVHQLGVMELLLPSTSLDSDMAQTLRRNVSDHVTFLSVPRKDFSEVKGLRLIEHIACDSTVTTVLRSSSLYLAVSAATAVIHYVEYLRKASLSPKSAQISYECLKHRVGIDRDSCKLLEIIAPAAPGATPPLPAGQSRGKGKGGPHSMRQGRGAAATYGGASPPGQEGVQQQQQQQQQQQAPKGPPPQCLMGLVDHTLTQGGCRLLRSNLMMPVKSPKTLNDRLDSVAYLMDRDPLRAALRTVLRGMKDDMDHVLSKFVMCSFGRGIGAQRRPQPEGPPQQQAPPGDGDEAYTTTSIQHVLGLRGLIEQIPSLIDILERASECPVVPRVAATAAAAASGPTIAPLQGSSSRAQGARGGATEAGGGGRPQHHPPSGSTLGLGTAAEASDPSDRGVGGGDAGNPVLLHTMHKALLLSSEFDSVKQAIDAVIDESVQREVKKSAPIITKTLHVFAVRPGVDGLLDVVRARYSAVLEEVYGMAGALSTERKIPNLRAVYKNARGFVLQCENSFFQRDRGECGFIHPTSGPRRTFFTTRALVSLNNKLRDAYSEIMQRTNSQVRQLVDSVRGKLPYLFRVSEAVSLLDFIQSIATYCRMQDTLCRPSYVSLSDSASSSTTAPSRRVASASPVEIHGMVHPFYRGQNYIPNSVNVGEGERVVLLSGANMTGKTTYLLNIALLFVLGHVGFFLPAESARIFLMDRLFTRISLDDSVEQNASTFTMEMREMNYVLRNATESSLVVIDELGRGTSHLEGTAIAYAVAEHMASPRNRQGVTFFATHFHSLQVLASVSKHVSLVHCTASQQGGTLKPLFKVAHGSFFSSIRYGIALAKQMGIPQEVVADATRLCSVILDDVENPHRQGLDFASPADRVLLMHSYAAKVIAAAGVMGWDAGTGAASAPPSHLLTVLSRIKDDLVAFLKRHGTTLAAFLDDVDRMLQDTELTSSEPTLKAGYEDFARELAGSTEVADAGVDQDDIPTQMLPCSAGGVGSGGGGGGGVRAERRLGRKRAGLPAAGADSALLRALMQGGKPASTSDGVSVSNDSWCTRPSKRRTLPVGAEAGSEVAAGDDAFLFDDPWGVVPAEPPGSSAAGCNTPAGGPSNTPDPKDLPDLMPSESSLGFGW